MRGSTVSSRVRQEVRTLRESLERLREILFANIVMVGEIPSPTGGEALLVRFLSDRFIESGLLSVSMDGGGNVAGILRGSEGTRNLLIAAHLDKIWAENADHTVSVGVGSMSGRGLADNALGVAVLATLPEILRELGIELRSNLILLGTSRSFGRGDLGGMRFFLENSQRDIAAALCVEGVDLGRLSYSSLGMVRGEITAEASGIPSTPDESATGCLSLLHPVIGELMAINARVCPDTRVLIGTVDASSGYNVPPYSGVVRFEIRSENAAAVEAVAQEITEVVRRLDAGSPFSLEVEMIAHRQPGNLGEDHSLVKAAKIALNSLNIESSVVPSVSELSALLDRGIPALTLGITRGNNRATPRESIELEPIFDGLAQLVSVIQHMDKEEFRTIS